MTKTAIILGANGRFGRSASEAFINAGWAVRTFTRSVSGLTDQPEIKRHIGNAMDATALIEAARGCDVIVNALNPPYQNWKRDLPKLTEAVLHAAKATGATIMLPGNVYNYGANMPAVLTEDTPHRPTTRKGQMREDMEEAYAVAADDGVQTVILRGGDFIERAKTGNWFDTYIAQKADRGKITYPGPLDRIHAWAYLPDMARAMAQLADKRAELGPFTAICFGGFNLTGADLVEHISKIHGRKMRVSAMPWPIMRVLGFVASPIREVMEMRYLWQVPHAVRDDYLRELLPDYRRTPIEAALKDALGMEEQPIEAGAALVSA